MTYSPITTVDEVNRRSSSHSTVVNLSGSNDRSGTEEDSVKESGTFTGSMNNGSRLNIFSIILLETKVGIKQQMKEDKRFHPIIMGLILVFFLLSVSFFISYMEDIEYFDSFYACFITYSTIGFGDIDIFVRLIKLHTKPPLFLCYFWLQKISFRTNWFNLLIYGNFIHITGYMILSAWISSILEKFGVRKF